MGKKNYNYQGEGEEECKEVKHGLQRPQNWLLEEETAWNRWMVSNAYNITALVLLHFWRQNSIFRNIRNKNLADFWKETT